MIKDIIHKKLMKRNTTKLRLEVLEAEVKQLKREIKVIKNDRASKRDTTKDENKRTLRGKPKKVYSNKRTVNRLRNEI